MLHTFIPSDPFLELGVAVNYLMGKPAYASMKFRPRARILAGQINRRQYCFIKDEEHHIVGPLGWAFAAQPATEKLYSGGLMDIQGHDGDCVIFNLWCTDSPEANRVVLDAARLAMRELKLLHYRRLYSDRRWRLVRLAVNRFVKRHLERRSAQLGPCTPAIIYVALPAAIQPSGGLSLPTRTQVPSNPPSLVVAAHKRVRTRSPVVVALGLPVDYLMAKPVYARANFYVWVKVLTGQINCGHYELDANERVVGMLGWSRANRDTAERWVVGDIVASVGGQGGDRILFNIWSGNVSEFNALLHDAAWHAMSGAALMFTDAYTPTAASGPSG